MHKYVEDEWQSFAPCWLNLTFGLGLFFFFLQTIVHLECRSTRLSIFWFANIQSADSICHRSCVILFVSLVDWCFHTHAQTIFFFVQQMCCGCRPLDFRAFKAVVIMLACLMVVMGIFSIIGGFVDALKTYYTPYFACIIGVQALVVAALAFCCVALLHHQNEWVPKGVAIAHVVLTASLLLMIFPASIVSGVNWSIWIGANCFSSSTVCSSASAFGTRLGIALGVSTACFFIFTILYLVVAIKYLLRLMLDQSWRDIELKWISMSNF